MSKDQIEELARIMLEKSKSANAEPIFTAEDGTEIVLDEKSLKLIDVILEQAYIPFLAEVIYNAGYRKQSEGEWLSAYAYAVKLGVTDAAKLEELKGDKWWKFCSRCEQQVRWYFNFCPNCGAKMKGGADQ